MSNILEVSNLKVNVEDKEILHGVNLSIGENETHVLMGPNGAGKSTLGYAVMGSPRYTITGGSVVFDGRDITGQSTDKIAKAGMFLSFQIPVEVPGITLSNFIKTAIEQKTGKRVQYFDFRDKLENAMDILHMDHSYAMRDLNVGFSGGEKKKAEILQLLMLEPKLAILDETDSGLDVDAARTVSEGVRAYKKNVGGSLLIITHSTRILEALDVDVTHVLADGRIVKEGDGTLVNEINENGYEQFLEPAAVNG